MAIYRIKRFSSIRISRPRIEISGSHSTSSSSYDSEDPENNYHYESNGGYHGDSDSEPQSYEEEVIETPEGRLERSSEDEDFNKEVEGVLRKESGLGDELKDFGSSDGRLTAGSMLGQLIARKIRESGILG